MSSNNDVMFGAEDQEQLEHYTRNDYIVSFLDGHLSPAPEVVDVQKYKRIELDPDVETDAIIENTIENWDVSLSDPEGDTGLHDPATIPEVREAAETFCKILVEHYCVWMCEPDGPVEEVDTLEWIKEHRPDWLNNEPDRFAHLEEVGCGGGN